jgi:hypothetical protein
MNVQHCRFCQRSFHFSDLYQQHVPTCEFFYKTRRDQLRDSELVEKLPTPAEMFRLIQYLMAERDAHATKIAQLEAAVRRVKKRAVLAHTPVPTVSWLTWIEGFQVQVAHIHMVFQDDLYEAMKRCIAERLDREGTAGVPLRTSSERPNCLYVWDMERQAWNVCPMSTLNTLFDGLASEFMSVYCNWEDENMAFLQSSQENKDKQVVYLLKISESATSAQSLRRRSELRTWLCKRLLYT